MGPTGAPIFTEDKLILIYQEIICLIYRCTACELIEQIRMVTKTNCYYITKLLDSNKSLKRRTMEVQNRKACCKITGVYLPPVDRHLPVARDAGCSSTQPTAQVTKGCIAPTLPGS